MTTEQNARPALILLAEDNRGDVRLILHAFQEHCVEHELLLMEDGEKAIEYIERTDGDNNAQCPDLVMLDLNLPKKDGEQILERMRTSQKYAHTPVVVLTSSDSPQDRAMAKKLGAIKYFQKPSDLEEFMNIGALVKGILSSRTESPAPSV